MKTNKDWADALREQCFPEEVSPSEGSWAGITDALRRRTARRWSLAAALALLLPVGGVLLFKPSSSAPMLTQEHTVLESPVPELLASLPPSSRVASLSQRKAAAAPVETVNEIVEPVAETVEPEVTPEEPVTVTVEIPVSEPEEETVAQFEELLDEEQPRRAKRVSVTLQGGSSLGQRDSYPLQEYAKRMSSQTKSANLFWNNIINNGQADQLHYRHDLPLSLALTLRWDLSSRLALESGISYTYLHSYGEQTGHQQLHFVGIPLKLDVRLFSAGPLDVSVGAYGMGEKCLSAVQGGVRYPETAVQWSAGAFLVAGYRLGSFATLYLQPSLSYYFTKTTLITYRTENPLGFTLQAGLRFHL